MQYRSVRTKFINFDKHGTNNMTRQHTRGQGDYQQITESHAIAAVATIGARRLRCVCCKQGTEGEAAPGHACLITIIQN